MKIIFVFGLTDTLECKFCKISINWDDAKDLKMYQNCCRFSSLCNHTFNMAPYIALIYHTFGGTQYLTTFFCMGQASVCIYE